MDNKIKCRACQGDIEIQNVDEYYICGECGSYNYYSTRSAEDDNNNYFNTFFNDFDSHKESRKKQKIYKFFYRLDKLLNNKIYNLGEVDENEAISIFNKLDGKILEIGFGKGSFLKKCFDANLDIYGVDLSSEAVSRCKTKYQDLSDRVFSNTDSLDSIKGVYSSALFEHLDDQRSFLEQISAKMDKGGTLIINNFPMVLKHKKGAKLSLNEDINFWKPCHRAIFTERGVTTLVERAGFKIEKIVNVDKYVYRNLSLILKKGYEKIEYYRNPKILSNELPAGAAFMNLCFNAVFTRAVAGSGSLVAVKK